MIKPLTVPKANAAVTAGPGRSAASAYGANRGELAALPSYAIAPRGRSLRLAA